MKFFNMATEFLAKINSLLNNEDCLQRQEGSLFLDNWRNEDVPI